MNLFLIRHGETAWNEQNRVLGRTDIELSDMGLRNAERLGKELGNISLDAIFSSPLKRAVQTAEAICKNQNCKILLKEALIEQNFGIFEGIQRDNVEYQTAKRRFYCPFEDGEGVFDVADRVLPFLEELAKAEYSNVAIVTHNGICRVISSCFENFDDNEFISYTLKNCGVKKYELTPQKLKHAKFKIK